MARVQSEVPSFGGKGWAGLLVTATVVPSSPILVTLMMEALSSSETSALTGTTRRNIPEDTILPVLVAFIISHLKGSIRAMRVAHGVNLPHLVAYL
jgi:hypothetical protein